MTIGTGVITGVSISHQFADLDTIEAASARTESETVQSLLARPGVTEALSLQTCNRAEAYVVTESPETGRVVLDTVVADTPEDSVRELGHEESLRHLMRVACGLESLVLGEDQILGQVREAYLTARAAGGTGPVFEEALTKAIHVGERARTETSINEGVVSLGSAAARLAARETNLDSATALVVGAGEMATLAARSFAEAAHELVIANRTIPHAEHIAQSLDADVRAVGLDALPDALSAADVVVSATASHDPVIDRSTLPATGERLLIDIAQPRDVDPDAATLPDVTVYDLDAIESVTDQTASQRQSAAVQVERMIDRELDRLLSQYKRKRADEVISAMYEGAEAMKRRELATALSQLEATGDLTDEQRTVVESLADALVSQLLAAPTKSLRDAAERDDWSTINTALQLFDPDFEGVTVPGDSDVEGVPEDVTESIPEAVLEQLGDD